jgi:catechol 2,3-dioxygenase-like lactoylglutathione lyase family enzyme
MALLSGAHVVVDSKDSEADRAFLRDTLGLRGIDSGGGWLIFALPRSEVAVHPAARSGKHELYFMCDDADAFVATLAKRGVKCAPVQDVGWGRLTRMPLPGGGRIGVYEPRHARPPAAPARRKRSSRTAPRDGRA